MILFILVTFFIFPAVPFLLSLLLLISPLSYAILFLKKFKLFPIRLAFIRFRFRSHRFWMIRTILGILILRTFCLDVLEEKCDLLRLFLRLLSLIFLTDRRKDYRSIIREFFFTKRDLNLFFDVSNWALLLNFLSRRL